jgi:hypothetical protein
LCSNFNNQQFWEYCENSGINVQYIPVAHPHANSLVEHVNRMVLDTLKSDCTMLLIPKEASGSRSYPMHFGASYSTYQANWAVALLLGL